MRNYTKRRLFGMVYIVLGMILAVLLTGCGKISSDSVAKSRSMIVEDGEQENQRLVLLDAQVTDIRLQVEAAKEEADAIAREEAESANLIVIDAGHQQHANNEKEPIGPGSSTMKAKVASGTSGAVSGLHEYELTLMVSLKLQEELENRGYQVIMIRTTNDVDISNAERAKIANEANADAFIRIHADGSEYASASGATTLCQTPDNPYNGDLATESKALSTNVLDGLCASTGCRRRSVTEVDNMSGINWCEVPVTIVEMGFMTNAAEDALMATEDYQWKIATGIADGIDAYFGESAGE